MKPIHWVVALVQAMIFPYILVTAVKLAIPDQGPWGPMAAAVFGAGCGLAGFVLVFEYAMGKDETSSRSTG